MFKRAQRRQAKLRLALMGPSGSGKTYSALLIAKGLGGRVAMIDTERGSGELYSDLHEYDATQLIPPFTPEKYINAIHLAEKAGYDIVIIDSLSHAWAGPGGVLDIQDRVAKSTRNSFSAWREVTPQHNALVDAILASPAHVIVTMRTKTAYEVVNDNGKSKVTKIGLAPVQRDGLEYEFTLVLDLAIEGHVACATKDRTGLFDGQYFLPNEETGSMLNTWLGIGEAPLPIEDAPPATAGQSFLMEQLHRLIEQLGIVDLYDAYQRYACARYDAASLEKLSKDQLIEQLVLLRQCKERREKLAQFVEILTQQRNAA